MFFINAAKSLCFEFSSADDRILNINKKDIEQYLSEVKEAVGNDRYRLDRNAKRQCNINLLGYEHERLYVL